MSSKPQAAITTPAPAPKRKLSHSQKAEQLGISTRTLDRWVENGVIAAPDIIRRRKYHAADSEPRRDAASYRLELNETHTS